MNLFYYKTDIGTIKIQEKNNSICAVYFEKEQIPQEIHIYESPILKEAATQLNKYFNGQLKSFSLPLAPRGTKFMKKVWEALCEIPYGRKTTYKQIAQKVGNPNAARAVGLACNRNPIPIFIPCHRVIGSNGKLTGYRGGIDIKKHLLLIEKNK